MNQQKAKTSYKYDFIFSLTLLQIQRNLLYCSSLIIFSDISTSLLYASPHKPPYTTTKNSIWKYRSKVFFAILLLLSDVGFDIYSTIVSVHK